jgi:hypothetical protein
VPDADEVPEVLDAPVDENPVAPLLVPVASPLPPPAVAVPPVSPGGSGCGTKQPTADVTTKRATREGFRMVG